MSKRVVNAFESVHIEEDQYYVLVPPLTLSHRVVETVQQQAAVGADWEMWLGDKCLWLGLSLQAKVVDAQSSQFAHLHYRAKGASLMPSAAARRFWLANSRAPAETAGLSRESVLHRYAPCCNLVRGRLLINQLNQSIRIQDLDSGGRGRRFKSSHPDQNPYDSSSWEQWNRGL